MRDGPGCAEARAADAVVNKATGEGLWSRDTAFGEAGYFGDIAFDEGYSRSHHVLTTDGIRGRDTVARTPSLDALRAGSAAARKMADGAGRDAPSGIVARGGDAPPTDRR